MKQMKQMKQLKQSKHRWMLVAVSIAAGFMAIACTMQVVPAVADNAAAPSVSMTSAATEVVEPVTSPVIHDAVHDAATPTPSAYRELLDSEIRGIDADTMAGYLAGEGLGMALPAELNGYPGPRHVLELRTELALTPEQAEQIQFLFDAMQPAAIELGQAILTAEARLESDFRNRTIDEEGLNTQLKQITDLQADLRFVHLRTHLDTVAILSPQQVHQYNVLRGYAEQEPSGRAGHSHQGHP